MSNNGWITRIYNHAGESILWGHPLPTEQEAKTFADESIKHSKATKVQRGKPVAMEGAGGKQIEVDDIARHDQERAKGHADEIRPRPMP